MKLKTTKFSPGDTVACYSGEVLEFGEVVSIKKHIVKVKLTRDSYKGEERVTKTVIQEYMLRGKDGLYVSLKSFDEYVPSKMIVHMDDIGMVNNWRYRPSLLEKIKRKFKKVGRLKRDKSPDGLEDAAKYWHI